MRAMVLAFIIGGLMAIWLIGSAFVRLVVTVVGP